MCRRERLDVSAYLVIGPENTLERPVAPIIRDAVEAGFTCIQIRSKVASAREMIAMTEQAAQAIAQAGKTDSVALIVNDRLDVVLAARMAGITVDGIHVGQSDIPVDVCRHYLGKDAIIGLSAKTENIVSYVKNADTSLIDYFGAGPLRATVTKKDCLVDEAGAVITQGLEDFARLAEISPIPVTVGGGVKLADIAGLAVTGVQGFFVVSAVACADEPRESALQLVSAWRHYHV